MDKQRRQERRDQQSQRQELEKGEEKEFQMTNLKLPLGVEVQKWCRNRAAKGKGGSKEGG